MAGNFYHKYRNAIPDIQTLKQRDDMLLALQTDFERYIRAYPWEKNELLETYKLLKRKSLAAISECGYGEKVNLTNY